MLRALPVVLALAVLSLALAAPAQGALITIHFWLFEGMWERYAGNFSFDSAVIPDGGGTVGALGGNDDFSSSIFVLYGPDGSPPMQWTSSNSGLSFLQFDADGNLTAWEFGGDQNGVGTIGQGGDTGDVIIQAFRTGDDFIGVSNPFQTWGGSGGPNIVNWGTEVPEPAPWMLLGSALVGLVGVRRRIRG